MLDFLIDSAPTIKVLLIDALYPVTAVTVICSIATVAAFKWDDKLQK